MGRPLTDLTGQRFGRLIVIVRAVSGPGRSYWQCQCDCGVTKNVAASCLKNGMTRSCGCLNSEVVSARNRATMTTHGQSKTPLYIVWQSMIRRCEDPRLKAYADYGGRGISVCREWRSPANFLAWAMTSGYSSGLTLDRRDNNGNYEPNNCRWVTMKVQCNNRRNNKIVVIGGIQKTASQWARERGISPAMFLQRLRLGWDPDRALTQPSRKGVTS